MVLRLRRMVQRLVWRLASRPTLHVGTRPLRRRHQGPHSSYLHHRFKCKERNRFRFENSRNKVFRNDKGSQRGCNQVFRRNQNQFSHIDRKVRQFKVRNDLCLQGSKDFCYNLIQCQDFFFQDFFRQRQVCNPELQPFRFCKHLRFNLQQAFNHFQVFFRQLRKQVIRIQQQRQLQVIRQQFDQEFRQLFFRQLFFRQQQFLQEFRRL